MVRNATLALLLEDEPLISMDIEQSLVDDGFDVTAVMTCQEATEWLDCSRPDVVIVDIMLRDGPYDRIVDRLVAASIPFIVHSGDRVSQHVGTPFAHGAWVSKPAAPGELADTARAMLAS